MKGQDTAGSTRDQVLTEIRTAITPPTVDEIAGSLGLHHNSVRLHANALRDSGLVAQGTRATGGRGRPLIVFRPTTRGARAGSRNYQTLAAVLVDHLADVEEDPSAAARAAGRAWGRRIASGRDQPDLVGAVLEELGFEPDASGTSIELRNCPFRELVDEHQQVVCSLHAGMLDGLVEHPDTEVVLVPFTSAHTCTVRVG